MSLGKLSKLSNNTPLRQKQIEPIFQHRIKRLVRVMSLAMAVYLFYLPFAFNSCVRRRSFTGRASHYKFPGWVWEKCHSVRVISPSHSSPLI